MKEIFSLVKTMNLLLNNKPFLIKNNFLHEKHADFSFLILCIEIEQIHISNHNDFFLYKNTLF